MRNDSRIADNASAVNDLLRIVTVWLNNLVAVCNFIVYVSRCKLIFFFFIAFTQQIQSEHFDYAKLHLCSAL